MASEPLCHLPGQCWILNLNWRVYSLSLNNRGLVISLSSRFSNIPSNGAWSVTTVRLGQAMTNMGHLAKAQAIAVASPSIVAYWLSASLQNLDQRILDSSHLGSIPAFWSWGKSNTSAKVKKHIPCLVQSGDRHVTRFTSNVDTPSSTSFTMTLLECDTNSKLWMRSSYWCQFFCYLKWHLWR